MLQPLVDVEKSDGLLPLDGDEVRNRQREVLRAPLHHWLVHTGGIADAVVAPLVDGRGPRLEALELAHARLLVVVVDDQLLHPLFRDLARCLRDAVHEVDLVACRIRQRDYLAAARGHRAGGSESRAGWCCWLSRACRRSRRGRRARRRRVGRWGSAARPSNTVLGRSLSSKLLYRSCAPKLRSEAISNPKSSKNLDALVRSAW